MSEWQLRTDFFGWTVQDEIARREYAGVAAGALVSRWERTFTDLLERCERLDSATRLPWFGPDMSARSFVTARLMETWAHGQDIYDALGVVQRPTRRLKHIAHLGVSTFRWSYVVRGQQPPEEAPRVELRSGGDIWTWNEGSRSGAVRGPAMDFCLVVTQRRNLADTALETTGPVAVETDPQTAFAPRKSAAKPTDAQEPGQESLLRQPNSNLLLRRRSTPPTARQYPPAPCQSRRA